MSIHTCTGVSPALMLTTSHTQLRAMTAHCKAQHSISCRGFMILFAGMDSNGMFILHAICTA